MLLATDPRGYAACSAAIRDMDMRPTARLVAARAPWHLDESGPAAALAVALERALTDPGHPAPPPFHAPYWMEAPLWQAAGIPALVCGPAGGGLHAADEWVDLGQVRRYTRALVAAVGSWSTEHRGH